LNIETLVGTFLKSQPMATVSTIARNSNIPESALIAFAQTDKLEIIFESFVNARKWKNLQSNPHVSLVIGWDTQVHITVQYEGVAKPIPEAERSVYINMFLAKKTPCTEKFLNDPRVRLFKVRPTWMRYSDYTNTKPLILEKSFAKKETVYQQIIGRK
jgi:general stress protein 26